MCAYEKACRNPSISTVTKMRRKVRIARFEKNIFRFFSVCMSQNLLLARFHLSFRETTKSLFLCVRVCVRPWSFYLYLPVWLMCWNPAEVNSTFYLLPAATAPFSRCEGRNRTGLCSGPHTAINKYGFHPETHPLDTHTHTKSTALLRWTLVEKCWRVDMRTYLQTRGILLLGHDSKPGPLWYGQEQPGKNVYAKTLHRQDCWCQIKLFYKFQMHHVSHNFFWYISYFKSKNICNTP